MVDFVTDICAVDLFDWSGKKVVKIGYQKPKIFQIYKWHSCLVHCVLLDALSVEI